MHNPTKDETISELLTTLKDLVINVYEDVPIDEMSKHLISSLNEAAYLLDLAETHI